MKYLATITLCVAAAVAQQPSGQAPIGLGNFMSTLASTYNLLTKTLTDAGQQLGKGVPPNIVLSEALSKVLNEAKLHTRVDISSQTRLRSESKKSKASFGPYKLVGKNDYRPMSEVFSLDPRGQGTVSFIGKGNLCGGKDCTILSARIGLTYADGTDATPETGVYIHHLLSFLPGVPSVNSIGFCDVAEPEKDIGFFNNIVGNNLPFSPFTGRGEDGGPVSMIFTSGDGKFNSGFHIGKDDVIVVQSDIVNYKNVSQNVYVTYEYEWVEGFQGVKAITTLLSVAGCLLVIPPKVNMTGRAVTVSRKFPITNDATLLNMRGHMHDGGDEMILAVNNKTVCNSLAEYKSKALWSMTSCGNPVEVKKGDYITLSSVYDVTKHPLRPGVMDSHSHAKNVFGMNDLMGMYAVTFATKPKPKA